MNREYSLGAVLTVTSGGCCLADLDEIYAILGYLTGEEGVMTHQLPRLIRECQQPLIEQHPQFAGVTLPEGVQGKTAVLAWLAEREAQFGSRISVEPIDPINHTRIDPLTELDQMRGGKPFIVMEAPSHGEK